MDQVFKHVDFLDVFIVVTNFWHFQRELLFEVIVVR
jgi:hypothetical protein